MIKSPIAYAEPEKSIVDKYNARRAEEKTGKYWEDAEIEPVRNKAKKHYVLEQGYRCCYCNREVDSDHGRIWDCEHIVAKATHPEFLFEPKNLAIACIDCNSAKSDTNILVNKHVKKYPANSASFLVVHPHFDDFDDHLEILNEFFYNPLSDKGKKTIYVCDLSRFSMKSVGWSTRIANNDVLKQKMNSFLSADDPNVQKKILMEVIMIASVRISKELFGGGT